MHSTTILTLLLTTFTALTSASPAPSSLAARQDTYHGVSINATVSPGLSPQKTSETIAVEIARLTTCYGGDGYGCSVSALALDPSVAINVDINTVECRGYKDFEGTVPGSAPFNVSVEADISTNLSVIGSILCYIVET